MEKTLSKTVLFLLIMILIFISIFIIKPQISNNNLKEYSFTKAICDENNYCEDYEIICEKNNIKGFISTGFAIQNSDNWNDPRTSEQIEKMCD